MANFRSGPRRYYPPTVLTGVRLEMPTYAEELFGPVAAVIPVAIKDIGHRRELSRCGLPKFVSVKTVMVRD